MKRLITALLLTAAVGGIAKTANAGSTLPVPDRPVYYRTVYYRTPITYTIIIPQIGFSFAPMLLR